MKVYLSFFITTVLLLASSCIKVSAQDTGETSFKQTCAACHTIGKGRLVGPDLANIQQRRPQDWIANFIKSSQSVIKSGDKYADSLFLAYNQLVMPDHPSMSDEQVKNLISYIETKSAAPTTTGTTPTPEQIGQKPGNKAGNLFSTTNILFFAVILFQLFIILFLARVNKGLLDQIKDYYSSNSAFLKK